MMARYTHSEDRLLVSSGFFSSLSLNVLNMDSSVIESVIVMLLNCEIVNRECMRICLLLC